MEAELRRNDTVNIALVQEEQLNLMVERDLEEVLQNHIETGKVSSVRISFKPEYMERMQSYLTKQEIDFIRISPTQIVIKG